MTEPVTLNILQAALDDLQQQRDRLYRLHLEVIDGAIAINQLRISHLTNNQKDNQ